MNVDDADNKILQKRNRRLEYGEYYDHFFKRCDNCAVVFNIRHLFYLNINETVKVFQKCLDTINYEQGTRELRRKYG